jgi:type VI protein secretion system component VasF
MHINFTPWMILWAALALAVLVMAGYRKIASVREDETLHLVNPSESARQLAIFHKLERIDKWGRLLTVVAAIYGLLLVMGYTYQTWVQATYREL